MAAYLINDMEITDPVTFEEYRKLALATIAARKLRQASSRSNIIVIEGVAP